MGSDSQAVTADPVALQDLAALHAPLRQALSRAFERVLDSQRFIMGPEVEAFEAEVADSLGAPHAVGVSSGTDALLVALMALGIGPGDEVITTPFSFFATAGSIARVGATPVFVDIDPDSFNLDTAQVADAVTSRTKAIMPVHLFGQRADMRALGDLCQARALSMIEDAAQAIGCGYMGSGDSDARDGDVACFSLFPAKNLGALGDAGLVITRDDKLAARLRALRTHGAERKYVHQWIGGNFRLDALQAALLRVKLPHLQAWTNARRQHAATYDRRFAEAGLDQAVLAAPTRVDAHHVYNQYVVRCADRDGLRARLAAQGIETAIYYPSGLHQQPCFAHLSAAKKSFPVTEAACKEVLALPVHPTLTTADIERVADAATAFARGL